MDSLPDELLLEIFSKLDDWNDLVRSVGLVCRRWHKLSKCPEAWTNICVDVTVEDESSVLVATEQLRRAPALRSIVLWLLDGTRDSEDALKFLSVLKTGPTRRVASVELGSYFWEAGGELLHFLWRCRHSVLELSLDVEHATYKATWPREHLRDEADDADPDPGLSRNLLDVIAAMTSLRKIHVDNYSSARSWSMPEIGPIPGDKLCPTVTSLTFQDLQDKGFVNDWDEMMEEHDDDGDPLALGLLRGSARVLRDLDFATLKRLPRTLEDAVKGCRSVRSLRINLLSLHVVQDMAGLRALFLTVMHDPPLEEVQRLHYFLVRAPHIGALRDLRLYTCQGAVGIPPANVNLLVTALSERCAGLRTLMINVEGIEERTITRLLERNPELHTLTIMAEATTHHVRLLTAGFPQLTKVELRSLRDESTAEAIADFRQRRPNVDLTTSYVIRLHPVE